MLGLGGSAGAIEPHYREAHAAFQRLERETAALLAREHVFVHVVHHDHAWLKAGRDHVRAVAEALAAYVRGMLANGQHLVTREDLDALEEDFPPELAGFTWAVQVETMAETSVHASCEQYRGSAPVGRVQGILDDKERCVAEYRERDPEAQLWLLVTTHTDVAERLIRDLLKIEHVFASSFDRAFLLDGALWKVRELRLEPPGPAQ